MQTHCIKRWFDSDPVLSFTRPIIPDMKFVAGPKGETSQASPHKPHVSHYRNISTLYFAKPPLLIKSSQAFRKAELPFRALYSDRTSERKNFNNGPIHGAPAERDEGCSTWQMLIQRNVKTRSFELLGCGTTLRLDVSKWQNNIEHVFLVHQ